MNNKDIQRLADRLLEYKEAYYSGNSMVPDAVYDGLEEKLRLFDPGNPVLSFVGVKEGGKVSHDVPMLSLAKTYDEEVLHTFCEENEVIMTPKVDGMSLAVRYGSDGRMLRAVTRGNGMRGEDVTTQARLMNGIPSQLDPGLGIREVRGEVYFPTSKFEDFRGVAEGQFESLRNAVAGTFARKDISTAIKALRVLRFMAYEVHATDSDSFLSDLRSIERQGFETPPSKKIKPERINNTIEKAFEERRDYLIDGLVFRINDNKTWKSKGATGHHPRGSLAFKIQGETALTTIRGIEINIGRTGKLSFAAVLDPVQLSGATISRATLHNIKFIEDGGYGKEASVKIVRSGEVIPYIQEIVKCGERFVQPTRCHSCSSTLERVGPDIFCRSNDCRSRKIERLLYFIKSLEVTGISKGFVTAVFNAGLVTQPADFFTLTEEDLIKLDGFQERSARKAVDALQSKKVIRLRTLLASLGIPTIGKRKSRELESKFGSMSAIAAAEDRGLIAMGGWGEVNAANLKKGLKQNSNILKALLNVLTIQKTALNSRPSGHLTGKTFVLTGKMHIKRIDLEAQILNAGGITSNTVGSATSFLVSNKETSSNKFRKAKKLKIPIISEAELLKLLISREAP